MNGIDDWGIRPPQIRYHSVHSILSKTSTYILLRLQRHRIASAVFMLRR